MVENSRDVNDDFPAGILESTRGRYTDYILFDWDSRAKPLIVSFLRQLAKVITTRTEQLGGITGVSAFLPGGTVLTAGLSGAAFRDLNVKAGDFKVEELQGTFLEEGYKNAFSSDLSPALTKPKVILVVNHNEKEQLQVAVEWLKSMVADAGILGGHDLTTMHGETLRKKFYDSQKEAVVNSFGYAEGRSGRVSLDDKWEATRIDFNVGGQKQYGSLMCFIRFVFDNSKFEGYVREIAARLFGNCSPENEEIEYVKGALMGRFPDGSPLALTHQPILKYSTDNLFNYTDDVSGVKCPLSAHIRVVNDRKGSSSKRIVRRGVSFLQTTDNAQSEGLYFVSYQASVSLQLVPIFKRIFELQDSILYRNNNYVVFKEKQWRKHPIYHPINKDITVSLADLNTDFITYTGEEYFYMPPRSFLSSLPLMEEDAL